MIHTICCKCLTHTGIPGGVFLSRLPRSDKARTEDHGVGPPDGVGWRVSHLYSLDQKLVAGAASGRCHPETNFLFFSVRLLKTEIDFHYYKSLTCDYVPYGKTVYVKV